MNEEKFESVIGYHCAPVLMGVKPSNLVSFSKGNAPELPQMLEKYAPELQKRGIQTEIVCGCRKHYLVLVYRPEILRISFRSEAVLQLLEKYGYDRTWNLSQQLQHLKSRFETGEGLPHEIGLFLGYPLEDVLGFCEKKGEGCKLCGYWKVYGDVAAAKKTFATYDRCRAGIAAMLKKGHTILQAMDCSVFDGCFAAGDFT